MRPLQVKCEDEDGGTLEQQDDNKTAASQVAHTHTLTAGRDETAYVQRLRLEGGTANTRRAAHGSQIPRRGSPALQKTRTFSRVF